MDEINLSEYRNTHSRKSKVIRLLWEITWLVLFRPTPRWCLNGWRCFLLRTFGAKIGKGVRIQGSAHVWIPSRLRIGDHSWIDGSVNLYSVAEISIGSNTVVSEGAFLCTATHDIHTNGFELVTQPLRIGNNAWIASRAIVLPGIVVGDGSVIGAGAVVTRNVDSLNVVAGNPARVVGSRKK